MERNKNTDFKGVVKRISPTLKRITYKLNGHFTFFNDEDLFQEALLHLWQDFNSGKLNDKTDSYILQGCYFHLKNHIRKSKVRNKLVSLETIINEEGASLEETTLLQDERSARYFDDLNNKMLIEVIQNNGLTRRQKHILLFYADGLTTREIGRRMGISHVMVVKLMHRIKNKCRRYLDNP
jgi:RNA polymerase sigma factor (sigma-70 family)